MRLSLSIQLLFVLLLSTPLTAAEQRPPNVVLIFADDLGYGDLGCYGATKVHTPNIDRLAAEGRRFTDAHSASAVCTPSRYALLTGQYPVRANNGRGVWGPAPVTSSLIVDTEKTTIADVFRNAGYDTGVIGKWHLGFGKDRNDWKEPLRPGPLDLGFDYFFGIPVVNSAPPYVYVENDRVVGSDPDDPLVYVGRGVRETTPLTPIPPEAANRSPNAFRGARKAHVLFNDYQVGTTFAKKSVEWISERRDKPFFLYLATTNIHHPFTPAKQFQGTSQCGLYGDFIHELDWIVGEVMTCLEDNGVADNTLVIFTSDNGGMFNIGGQTAFKAGHRQNGDLLGFKFGVWEGGHRVPMIVRWPGKVKPGTVSEQVLGNVDMLATFSALTGHKLEKAEQADSVNMLPAFVDDPEEQIRDHIVLAPHKGTHLSIRKGKWMYIPGRGSGGFGGKTPNSHTFAGPAAASFVGSTNSDIVDGKIRKDAPPAQLYDLEADVHQTKNVHDEHPDVVTELTELLARYKPKPGPRKAPARKKGDPATKVPATPSTRDASFDFESGKLAPWRIVEGEFGHIIGRRTRFFRDLGEYNKQGEYYLTTLESSPYTVRGKDSQTGIIVSPMFVPEGGRMTFRVGGGSGPGVYVALCTEEGKENLFARGIDNQVMQKVEWDLSPFAGKKMFIKVVDQSTTGWGHITADNFQFDGEVLDEYPVSETSSHRAAKPQQERRQDAAGTKKSPRPNFVVIFTDDQGYQDVGCFGSPDIRTPRLDAMAKQGMKLTSFYAQPICGPSRAALMTGCYPMRVAERGHTKQVHPILHQDEITVAEVLKTQGYATACFGKWDLAKHSQKDFFVDLFPTRQGFDYFFGTPTSNDGIADLYRNEELVEPKSNMATLTQRYTDEAISFIEKNRHQPFFVYIPHTMPHTRLDASAKFKGKSQRGLYGDVIEEIDFNVGRILDALEELKLANNTYVLFTSDNGPWLIKNKNHADGHLPRDHGGSAGPLRSGKVSTFEGGVRVPTILWGPGRVPAGTTCDLMATTMDVLPTFAALASAQPPTDRVIDGEDIRHLFHGEFENANMEKAYFYYLRVHLQAVRQGPWKLHLPREKEPPGAAPFSRNNHIGPADRVGFDEPFLVNLNQDLGETTNVAAENPQVVERLLALAESMRDDLGDYDRVGKNMRFFDPLESRPTKPPVPPPRRPRQEKLSK